MKDRTGNCGRTGRKLISDLYKLCKKTPRDTGCKECRDNYRYGNTNILFRFYLRSLYYSKLFDKHVMFYV